MAIFIMLAYFLWFLVCFFFLLQNITPSLLNGNKTVQGETLPAHGFYAEVPRLNLIFPVSRVLTGGSGHPWMPSPAGASWV